MRSWARHQAVAYGLAGTQIQELDIATVSLVAENGQVSGVDLEIDAIPVL